MHETNRKLFFEVFHPLTTGRTTYLPPSPPERESGEREREEKGEKLFSKACDAGGIFTLFINVCGEAKDGGHQDMGVQERERKNGGAPFPLAIYISSEFLDMSAFVAKQSFLILKA